MVERRALASDCEDRAGTGRTINAEAMKDYYGGPQID